MTNTTSTDALVLTEQIHAPREAIYEFLVDPDKLSRWMGAATIDPRPGGNFQLDVGDNRALGEYVHLDPPSSVSFTWGWENFEAVPPGSTVVTISLIALDDTTTAVELRHEGLPLGPADEHKGGWTRCLDALSYEVAREHLRSLELQLMLDRERVAEARRQLPLGPSVDNYSFGSPSGSVALEELFTADDRPLVLYHFMFGNEHTSPCPMCAMWADGWNGVAEQIAENVDFAIVTSASVDENQTLATARGWNNLRFLSAKDTTFKADIGGESDDGHQMPFISVYVKTDTGPRLTYSGGAHIEQEHWRGVDLLSPVWHLLDLTPRGRGDWLPST
ncbi:MAG: DUF899 family protein [Acidimicrobiia bacterium]|nr:DUF899 family protein [Acidimicrobiia bacterium]